MKQAIIQYRETKISVTIECPYCDIIDIITFSASDLPVNGTCVYTNCKRCDNNISIDLD